MYEKKTEEEWDCGIRIAFKVFGGKWKLCIIDAISKGITRPADIVRSMPSATARVIEMQLAELLFYGAVERSAEDVYPKKTEYRLTALGITILPLLLQIDRWGTAHASLVKERYNELMDAE